MDERITLAHGSGGEKYRELVEGVFLPAFSNPYLNPLTDSAILDGGQALAMTTDSYVVRPLFFPGGDIGSLAVSGTVNDLAVSGAVPRYLSVGMILEAGLEIASLRIIVGSIARTAALACVPIVTGDTKVIEGGGKNGIFINTAGIGVFPPGRVRPPQRIEPGDRIIVSGCIASHGMAVMAEREQLGFSPPILSDAAPLGGLVDGVLRNEGNTVHAMRDPTRGGVAAVLCEWVTPDTDILIHESAVPIRPDVASACRLLGLDPLFIACEGVILFSVPACCAENVLSDIRHSEHGGDAVVLGEVVPGTGEVFTVMDYSARRRIHMPRGELLPRIC